ncbi:MAG: cholesterol oxidase [Frankiales bacterium]|nr:cholesterol oxidase [Frankiales bacterium]
MSTETTTDVIVIGSGFGGSVTALRLAEKGYAVTVLEAGRRFTPETLPKTSWDLRAFLWMPRLGLTGMQRITWLKDVVILSGAGVGGGSLVYANTLYTPPPAFFQDPQWAGITNWESELAPHYDQAQRMLGVVDNPTTTPSDVAMQKVASDMGVGHTYRPTPVGVFFGEPGKTVDDPYFGGAGPRRTGCIQCGNCMIGCRFGAKNRLDTNYLYLAERKGAIVAPLTTATAVAPQPDGSFVVETVPTGKKGPVTRRRAAQVVVAAGTLGTQKLLHDMRDTGVLPHLSSRLGMVTRTNSEALLGAQARGVPAQSFDQGVAITSSFHPDEVTHIEPVRYGKGSNAMGLLATILVDGGGRIPRWLRFLLQVLRHPYVFARSMSVRHWSEKTIIVLVMQTLDNSISVRRTKRGRLTSAPGHGAPNPTWIPVAHEATRRIAAEIGGFPGGTVGDITNVPMTAHIIGGCVISPDASTGVIDAYHRVHGYPTLHVVDGAAISANLGVNPSLTITAQAERAMSLWPNKGRPDTRPAQGEDYVRIAPIMPESPAVPGSAPGALRLTAPEASTRDGDSRSPHRYSGTPTTAAPPNASSR